MLVIFWSFILCCYVFMAFQCFYKRGSQRSSDVGQKVQVQPQKKSSDIVEVKLVTNWDDVTCPICLNCPHNAVLLQCSSYEQGCRAFVCDTNHLHSNCLDRFNTAYGVLPESNSPSDTDAMATGSPGSIPESSCKPICPLCRGEVNGWLIIEKARQYLDQKKRYCDEDRCSFVGTYLDLQKHALEEHPNSTPSRIDPARQLDWENFQQSSDIVDVLSTIHSEVPHGFVLGDYVIEYGDDTVDEFENFPGHERNWWKSCMLYQVFEKLRSTRNRRRSRNRVTSRGRRHSSTVTSNSDDSSVTSIEFADQREVTR